jgi:small subunit ribosomal protein S8
MTDPIADMLTRVRNGYKAKHHKVDVPGSKMKHEIARILLGEGFIQDFSVIEDSRQNLIRMILKYDERERPAIAGLTRISKPGLRKYVGTGDLPRVMGGLGVAILSTSVGVLTDGEARQKGVGGEVICYVW